MSLRPDHVEGARTGLWSGPFAYVTTLFDADLVRMRAGWASMRETGVMLEQNGRAMEPREGHMGNVGFDQKRQAEQPRDLKWGMIPNG
jgi:hypothetical protein